MPSAFAHRMNFVPIFWRFSMPIAGMAPASAGIGGASIAFITRCRSCGVGWLNTLRVYGRPPASFSPVYSPSWYFAQIVSLNASGMLAWLPAA